MTEKRNPNFWYVAEGDGFFYSTTKTGWRKRNAGIAPRTRRYRSFRSRLLVAEPEQD